ncbi:MAG: hypothetical protein H0U25_12740 [Thermoleophilaceae bacterium]|nr:hypothetical protein [Thermoleophilaceae bacterium]
MTLPQADVLAAGLVGRPVQTYVGLEVRIVGVENGAVVVANNRGGECARVALADVQAGLDQLDAEGEVAVAFGALGPWATYGAAMLAEVEGAAYDASSARVTLSDAG